MCVLDDLIHQRVFWGQALMEVRGAGGKEAMETGERLQNISKVCSEEQCCGETEWRAWEIGGLMQV